MSACSIFKPRFFSRSILRGPPLVIWPRVLKMRNKNGIIGVKMQMSIKEWKVNYWDIKSVNQQVKEERQGAASQLSIWNISQTSVGHFWLLSGSKTRFLGIIGIWSARVHYRNYYSYFASSLLSKYLNTGAWCTLERIKLGTSCR